MKSIVKKLAAGVTACLCLASAMTGCYSEDKAWSAKRGDDTAPIGAYIYYLSSAYSEALGKVEDASKPVFDQKIDDKDGTQWIKDRAKESLQQMYYVDQKFEVTSAQLILTNAVRNYTVEMTVDHQTESAEGHTHAYKGTKPYKVNLALKVGEQVLLLRADGGQKFIVLDRVTAL